MFDLFIIKMSFVILKKALMVLKAHTSIRKHVKYETEQRSLWLNFAKIYEKNFQTPA